MKNTLSKQLTLCFALAVFWTGLSTTPALASEDKKEFDAHATAFNYFFKEGDMDFHFGTLVLGSADHARALKQRQARHLTVRQSAD